MTMPWDKRIETQLRLVREAYGPEGIHIGYQDGFYHQDCGFLVPEGLVGAAHALTHDEFGAAIEPGPARHGYGMVRLTRPGAHARDAIETVRRAHGVAAAAYHHILSVAPKGGGNLCPADEPVFVPADATPTPAPAHGDGAGRGVRVRVIDTGLVEGAANAHPWLAGVDDGSGPNLAATFDDSRGYKGHGTFIAGVVRRVAPAAHVTVDNDLSHAGAIRELDLADALEKFLHAPDPPHVISLSAGGYFEGGECGSALRTVVERLVDMGRHRGRPVLVAAAGNDGLDGDLARESVFMPAGLEGVISVGALRRDGTGRACFSNYGRWVDVFAPGERLVNAFYSGDYSYLYESQSTCLHDAPYDGCTCVSPPGVPTVTRFEGMAQWSGTSFATPIVAGLIAASVSWAQDHGQQMTARKAADWLLEHAGSTPDGALRVLLPDHPVG